MAQICFQWDDTRMGAVMESFLGGLKDPRVSSYFAPVANAALYADHPSFPYKGIRNGAYINTKADHIPFSKVNSNFNDPPNKEPPLPEGILPLQKLHFLKPKQPSEAGLAPATQKPIMKMA